MSTQATAAAPAAAKLPNEEVIDLVVPITVGGVETKQLKMRRGKLSDRMATAARQDLSEPEQEVSLFGMLLGLSPEEMAQLDLADYGQVQKKYVDFTEARPSKPSAPKSSS